MPTKKKKKSGSKFVNIVLAIVLLGSGILIGFYFKDYYAKDDKPQKPVELVADKDQKKDASVSISYTWVSSMNGAMLSLSKDNTFSYEMPSVDEGNVLKGEYILKDNVLKIKYTDANTCLNKQGVYKAVIAKDRLILEKIEDDCAGRAETLEGEWFKL